MTICFAIQLYQKEKERKHLRGSGEMALKKKKWKKMKSKWRNKWKLYENVKLKNDLYWSNLKSCPNLGYHDLSLRYVSFLAFTLDNSSCFWNWLSREVLWKRDESKYILTEKLVKLAKLETNVRYTCQLNILTKKGWYLTFHLVFLPSLKVQHCSY